MHIFNQDKKPYLIITKDELLFRENPSDPDMQRHQFASIQNISLRHHHNPSDNLDVSLEVKMKDRDEPQIVQVSSLDNSAEEILSLIERSLHQKVQLSLSKETAIKNKPDKFKNKILIPFVFLLTIAGLSIFHSLFPPTFEDLKRDYLKAIYKSDDSLCSAKAIVAYQNTQKDLITINNYCGILGAWYKQSQKSIPKKHLETEFSQLTYSDYIAKAKQDLKNKDYPSSKVSLEKAIYLNPNDSQAYLTLAQMHYLNRDKVLAIANNQKALSLNPNTPEAYSALGLIYTEKENYKKAEEGLSSFKLLQEDIFHSQRWN
jgi:tetratricopeptide (TPR) repeat protein